MNCRIPGRASLACLLLFGVAVAQEPLIKSGPKTGADLPGSFNPLNITGPDAGQKRCLV